MERVVYVLRRSSGRLGDVMGGNRPRRYVASAEEGSPSVDYC